MPYLSYISDELLLKCFKSLLDATNKGELKAKDNFERNIIDPFSTLLEMAIFDCDKTSWVKSETKRQAQKSLTNAIGTFHQQVLGSVDGWENLRTSNQVDLVNTKRKILAEVKNKHNTLKASDKATLYNKLHDMISKKNSVFKDYTAYYVEIIPDSSKVYDRIFTPSDSSIGSKCPSNEKIRYIDGRSFYFLASGDPEALDKLFLALPKLIKIQGLKINTKDFDFAQDFFIKAYK